MKKIYYCLAVLLIGVLTCNTLHAQTTYYMDANGSGDGSSWDEACWSFMELWANWAPFNDGDTILVADGTYSLDSTIMPGYLLYNRLVIEENIIVKSVNGPEVTIIQGAEATYSTPHWDHTPQGGCGDDAIRGVYMSAGKLDGFTIKNGYTRDLPLWSAFGGGIFADGSDNSVEITNCIIEDNVGFYEGGGIYARGDVTIHDCTINNNEQFSTVGNGGGGVKLMNGPTMYKTTVSNNVSYSVSSGGGIFMSSGNATGLTHVYDCLIVGNLASNAGGSIGGGIFCETSGSGGQSNVDNCTIANNVASPLGMGGGIILVNGGAAPLVRNCIVWNNTAGDGSDIFNFDGTIQYTCASNEVVNGVDGNITSDPQFVDADNGDYTLQLTSPCVDAGNNTYVTGTSDLAGNTRIVDDTVDMGAYEYQGIATYYYMAKSAGNWSATSIWFTSATSSTDPNDYTTAATETPTDSNSEGIIINANVAVDASVTIDQTTVNSGSSLAVNSGVTLTVADGDGTDLIISGTLDLDGGTLTMNGSLEYGALSTLEYSGTGGAQTTTTNELPATGCANLTILNANGVTLNSSTSISGDLFVNTGCSFTIGDYNFTSAGEADINGTLSIGTGTFDANTTFDATGGAVAFTGAGILKLGGSTTSLGTFTAGTGTVNYYGADQTIVAGSSISYNTVSLVGTGTKTANDALIATSLITANNNFNVELVGDGTTITNLVNFLNTGSVTLGNDPSDEFTFTGGIVTKGNDSNPSTATLQGTIVTSSASSAIIKLGDLIVSGNTTINPVGNEVRIGDITINNGKTLSVGTGSTGILYFDGTVDSEPGGTGHITINTNMIAPLAGNFGSTTPLGTITLTKGMVQLVSRNITAEALQINGGTFGFSPSGSWDINTVTIAGGATLNATTGSFNVSGNWTNSGTFNHKNGTVTFDGIATSEIGGSTGFYNFTCSTAGKTLKFDSDDSKSQTIANNFTISGTSGNPVVIAASTPDDAADIDVENASVNYADVTDSHNSGNTIYATNTTDNGNNQGWYFGLASDYIWAGRTDSDWNTANNWAYIEVPDEITDNVIILEQNHDPVIGSGVGATCNNLTINSGATLAINSGGSLITNGTITNNGTIQISRSISEEIWHLISAPVASATAAIFEGDYLQYWTESTATWTDITSLTEEMTPGQGYSLWATPDKSTFTTYTFTGTPNTGNVAKSITYTELAGTGFDGANLLGNPYPSSIDWSGLDDTYGAVYYWNGSAYVSWNDGSGAGTAYIPPMQGFFVVTTTNGTFNVGNANRTHSGASSYYKSSATLSGGLVLFSDNGSYQDELWLMQRDNQTAGFDLHTDAYKFMSNTPGISQLWSVCPDGNLSIDVRPYQETIQLGFANDTPGFYSIGISQMADITTAILEDTKNNIFHDLTKGDYEFAWDLADDEGRFVLHLGVTGIEQAAQQEDMLIYASGKTICLKPLQATTSGIFTLTDMSGRRIVQKELHLTGQTSVSVNATPGIYLASFTSEGSIVVKKVIIN